MTLQDLIDGLRLLSPAIVAPKGICNPHSWRGVYAELAFELTEGPTTVGEMLKAAESALGATYEGWKGGEFEMHGHTDVHIDMEGEWRDRSLELWLSALAAPASPIVSEAAPAAELQADLSAFLQNYRIPLSVRQASTKELEIQDADGFGICYFSGMESDKPVAAFLVAAANAAALSALCPNQKAAAVSPIDGEAPTFDVNKAADWLLEHGRILFDDVHDGEDAKKVAAFAFAESLLENCAAGPVSLSSVGGGGAGWISAKEQLPPATIFRASHMVLAQLWNKNHVVAYYDYAAGFWREHTEGSKLDITHWQPITPAPTEAR
jgi:hypothetical protein